MELQGGITMPPCVNHTGGLFSLDVANSGLDSGLCSGAGAISRGTKSSAGFLGVGAAITTATAAGAELSTGAIKRGMKSFGALGRCTGDAGLSVLTTAGAE